MLNTSFFCIFCEQTAHRTSTKMKTLKALINLEERLDGAIAIGRPIQIELWGPNVGIDYDGYDGGLKIDSKDKNKLDYAFLARINRLTPKKANAFSSGKLVCHKAEVYGMYLSIAVQYYQIDVKGGNQWNDKQKNI